MSWSQRAATVMERLSQPTDTAGAPRRGDSRASVTSTTADTEPRQNGAVVSANRCCRSAVSRRRESRAATGNRSLTVAALFRMSRLVERYERLREAAEALADDSRSGEQILQFPSP